MSLNELDKTLEKLVKDYQKTYLYILSRLKYQIDNNLSETHSLLMLKEIQLELKRLDSAAYKWAYEVLPEYYYLSLSQIDEEVALLASVSNVTVISGSLIVTHTKAIEEASKSLYDDLAKNTKNMSDEAKKIIRDNASEIITRQVISGESQKKTKQDLREALERDGITSFVDAGNKSWTIDKYTSMAVRTKSRILHNQGTMNRLKEYQEKYPDDRDNFDLIQISDHNSSCWCGKYENTVWSLSGNHPDYPPVTSLPNQPYKNFHPNCKHVWLSYMPGLRGKGQVISSQYLNRTVKDLMKEHYHSLKSK